MAPARLPDLGARLLLTERDAVLPILRRTPSDAFDRPTICAGWSVRDVLAHCGSALLRLAEGRLDRFTPELNEVDVAERRPWPLDAVLAELEQGYAAAVPALTAAGGKLDGVALGEWIHGGDVREALDEPAPTRATGLRTHWSCWSSAAGAWWCRRLGSGCLPRSCSWASPAMSIPWPSWSPTQRP